MCSCWIKQIVLNGAAPLYLFVVALPSIANAEPVRFQRDVRPILAANCFPCHGPDQNQRKAGLRLDDPAMWQATLESGHAAILPGNRTMSPLFQRVSAIDVADRMPPEKFGKTLTAEQVETLGRWIDEGAKWEQHWSFEPIEKPALPAVARTDWPRNEIDIFVLAELEERKLSPSPEADRRTLIRRLYFDLHGLPPSPEKIDAFVNDPDPAAYEKLVDGLLASPRYGERWGRHWLDVVHYADTHGYDKDKRRPNAWPYRDYVIRALNDDMPYTRFVTQQLAGDISEPGNPDGVVALGYIAAGPWDFVGNVEVFEDSMEKRNVRLIDRDDMVSTTMAVFTGLTARCARCHDHKFDPITQKDYYGLQAVFAGVERADRPYDADPVVGRIRFATTREVARLTQRQRELNTVIAKLDTPELKEARVRVAELEEKFRKLEQGKGSPSNGFHSAIESSQDVTKWVQIDLGEARMLDQIKIIPARPTDFTDTPGFGFPERFKVEVSEKSDMSNASDMSDVSDKSDMRTVLDKTAADVPNLGDEHTIIPAGDAPIRYVRITATKLWPRTNDYVFALAEVELLRGGQNIALGAKITALDSIEQGRWSAKFLTDGFTSRSRRVKLDVDSGEFLAVKAELDAARAMRDGIVESLLSVDVKVEIATVKTDLEKYTKRLNGLPKPQIVYAGSNWFKPEGTFTPPPGVREVHVLMRGDVNQPGDQSIPQGVAYFAELQGSFDGIEVLDEAQRRLALAKWITDARNPLTWRSIVNRVWHYHFGRGIVDTPNDFGYMGSAPTHPELLDWLAATFRDKGQSLKAVHKLIACSATYRQSSQSNAAAEAIDSSNQYLWRMNRQQLEAESIRDTVLAVAGKLNLEMYGPGYDLFGFLDDHSPHYKYAEHNPDDPKSFRRTVYRFIVRSVPDPFMEALDCADPSESVPVRNNTITALQALSMLNNPMVVRMSEHFAKRVEGLSTEPKQQIVEAFRLALGRVPSDVERDRLAAYAAEFGLANACRVLFNSNEFMFVD
jgi:hypothetical protein